MSYFYGYGQRHLQNSFYLETKVDDLEKRIKNYNTSKNFETVFEINIEKSDKIIDGTKIMEVKNGEYVLVQTDKTIAPTFGSNYIENTASNYMIFCCPELQFGNISIFVVSETPDTSGPGRWRYIVGNDDGSYDKFIGYKAYSYSEIVHGGNKDVSNYSSVTIPNRFSISHNKNLISCHWMQSGSCMFGNGSLLAGSEFKANLKHVGTPYSTIFLNPNFPTTHNELKGKIFGIKIVQGLLEPSDIVKIHNKMMKEYDVDV